MNVLKKDRVRAAPKIATSKTTVFDSNTVQSRNQSLGRSRQRTYNAFTPTTIPAGTNAATRKSFPSVLEMSPIIAGRALLLSASRRFRLGLERTGRLHRRLRGRLRR